MDSPTSKWQFEEFRAAPNLGFAPKCSAAVTADRGACGAKCTDRGRPNCAQRPHGALARECCRPRATPIGITEPFPSPVQNSRHKLAD
ncbi:hypothetical protein J6590_027706 [Homalodisca vitripennis]|nr:hypothetical protein J6590_027706 [Homalodisca vitripennis]